MPLWLDLLRTPIAAPETPGLRRLRLAWQLLCMMLAIATGLFAPLHRAWGMAAALAVATLLVAVLAVTPLYAARKHRADTAYLDRAGEDKV